MKRRNDWPEQLANTINAAKRKTFVWGENDCALFVCDCILAMTGEDLAERFRGTYTSAFGAAKALAAEEGVEGLYDLATKMLGSSDAAWLAKRGDVIGLDNDGTPALGIAMIGKAVFLLEGEGIVVFRLGDCQKSWRV